ncbi:hypothetical protein VTL71DRAFT_15358 [Oculimacula yallundae]|uniref:Uncharacterized protein n=1 Tax=Oculimacula yallundae TaxID=86028 RepID=A0ABR4CGC7_9HELO
MDPIIRSHGGSVAYPLPLSPDKQAVALELYIEYLDAELKESLEKNHPLGAKSPHSYNLGSQYDNHDVGNLPSVLPIEDEHKPTTPKATTPKVDLTSPDGKKMKERSRKTLAPAKERKPN